MSQRAPRAAPRDWGSASKVVAEAYFPHHLELVGGVHEPRLTLRTLDLGPVLIGHVGWGSDVRIECDYPDSYEVNMPITGHFESRGRHGTISSVVGQGTIFRANTPSLISHWDATCTVLGVKFDSDWLDLEAERVLGSDRVTVRSLLPEQLQLADGPGHSWRQLVASLATHLRQPDVFADTDLVRRQLAGAVTAGLLEACGADDGLGAAAHPRAIRRVIEEIHDDAARAWTAADMAGLAGTSVRRLQEGFQHAVGCAPSQYLLDVRLQRARADLDADPAMTVSDVAARWGFSSASRFAAAFKRRYGVPPSSVRGVRIRGS